MKKIVCGFDGSEQSMKAARMAADFAQKYGAELTLVYVVEPYSPPVDLPGISFVDWIEPHRKAATRLIGEAAGKVAQSTGVTPKTEVRVGPPANEIAFFAKDQGADLLVVGSRGQGAVKRILLGSVADHVVHLAEIPVLVVH